MKHLFCLFCLLLIVQEWVVAEAFPAPALGQLLDTLTIPALETPTTSNLESYVTSLDASESLQASYARPAHTDDSVPLQTTNSNVEKGFLPKKLSLDMVGVLAMLSVIAFVAWVYSSYKSLRSPSKLKEVKDEHYSQMSGNKQALETL